MDETYIFTANYRGKDEDFEARFEARGYTHRFIIDLGGTEVAFEKDEEGQYRAIVAPEHATKSIDRGLLESIALAIEASMR